MAILAFVLWCCAILGAILAPIFWCCVIIAIIAELEPRIPKKGNEP